MADRQTTGGYPRLGHVIRADVPKLAQRWLGDTVTFRAVTLEEARQALREQQAWLEEAVG
jgi:antagonist of KipI